MHYYELRRYIELVMDDDLREKLNQFVAKSSVAVSGLGFGKGDAVLESRENATAAVVGAMTLYMEVQGEIGRLRRELYLRG